MKNTSTTASPGPAIGFGFSFPDLYDHDALYRLDATFLEWLRDRDASLEGRLKAARVNPASLPRKQASELILEAGPFLEDFVAELFGITGALRDLQEKQARYAPLLSVKRRFVFRKAASGMTPEKANAIDGAGVGAKLAAACGEPLTEDSYTRHVSRWLDDEKAWVSELALAAEYAAWAAFSAEGRAKHHHDILFQLPRKLDPVRLVDVETVDVAGAAAFQLHPSHWRHREGFDLTDKGTDTKGALDQAQYCIKCHNQAKDSCSTGLREKTGEFKSSYFGVILNGCPLDEKISEMHVAKQAGNAIAAVAIVTIDNPMAAATGHRICNDCMKSCIYQKQDPVDIPQAETRSLKDVLDLPYGFEIYSLLTRWNPLNFDRPLPKRPTGHKVLIVGLGPAGFTLAHHLMNDGHTVVGIDGLKIEPLNAEVSGVTPLGERVPFLPVQDVNDIYENLNDRVMAGFGGVAEYGITVRWNKNFLKVIRLLLERRRQFAMFGGVRFGGTLTLDSAFDMGFDHVALCMGAGRPTVIPMKNGLAKGVRQASDFLMGLQLTGAARRDTVANLQVRLPIVVIGGGLTAIDTATESLAYYVVQVEKFLRRYEELVSEAGEAFVRATWHAEDRDTAEEFLTHARAIRAERVAAKRESREPELITLLNSWGGSTVAYRRRMIDSPSYTLNHEEINKALEEGVRFAEGLSPEEVIVDQYGHASALRLSVHQFDADANKLKATGEFVTLPARAILVAAGTQPNTVLAREHEGSVLLDGKYFRAIDECGNLVHPEKLAKPSKVEVLTSMRLDGKAVTFFGDLHPSFAGNVVKAMGGARLGYPVVSKLLERSVPSPVDADALIDKLNDEMRARVHEVIRLTPNIIEVVVKAPMAARAFEPGQFYRLQNFETLAQSTRDTTLAMEGLALTGASVNREQGLLSTIVLEMGGSSDLCAMLKPGEPVILMGPTGTPTETPSQETAMLVGGGLGNAVLFS
ncbi:MAG: FAD-dependent oxidoreductase, partial [Bryobacteraceae bacterium]|nr:FAD-dependent oxidoreductase [Bryobacteraceae bacterium]